MIRRLLFLFAAALLATGLAQPASAQFSDSYKFLKAVRDRDGNVVNELLSTPGSLIINTRDNSTGETALSIAVQRRDDVWVRFLLGKGANPNLADRRGLTPLMHATLLGFADGADLLIKRGAQVNGANRSGETPLIMAVQRGNAALVRLLMANGANPDRPDNIAGMSARDYARRDDRSGALMALLDAKPAAAPAAAKPVAGPK